MKSDWSLLFSFRVWLIAALTSLPVTWLTYFVYEPAMSTVLWVWTIGAVLLTAYTGALTAYCPHCGKRVKIGTDTCHHCTRKVH